MAPFKVIIAGGSLVGLSLALIFERLGIDYEVFEKGEIAPQLGASIGLHPHSLKILEQLGVWGDIEKHILPLQRRFHYDENLKCFEDSWVLRDIEENLHRPIIFMPRCDALKILYSHIQNKQKIFDHTAVHSYEENNEGVKVTTSDGKVHQCDMLIGADGIHSQVRKRMSEEIAKEDQALSKAINEGFTAEYKTLFAISQNDPQSPFLPDAAVQNTYYDGYSGVVAAGVPGLAFWFLFVKIPKSKTPNCPRYTEEDANNLAKQYSHVKFGPGYTLGDLWNKLVKSTLVPMEEGVLKKWSHGRVLLMGDAVHKATVNPGLGGNLAYEGIAHFTNLLHSLLLQNPNPSIAELTTLFNTFETRHRPRATTVVNLSGSITRYEAQEAWYLKYASRYIVPLVSDKIKANLYSNFSRGGPHLEFLPLPERDREEQELTENKKKMGNQGCLTVGRFIAIGGAVVCVGAAVWIAYMKRRG